MSVKEKEKNKKKMNCKGKEMQESKGNLKSDGKKS